MLFKFKRFIKETQMRHTIYKVRSQKAAWEKYLLYLQYTAF